MFGTAQQDLTGCGTGILGVVLVERGNTISGWIDLGKQGWLAQLGSGTDSTGFSRGPVSSGQLKPQRLLLPNCAFRRYSSFIQREDVCVLLLFLGVCVCVYVDPNAMV